MTERIRIVFMGTPEFAVPPLRALVKAGFHVAAVVTQPNRCGGRGRRLLEPPVKATARLYELPVIQPERVRDESFLSLFKDLAPHLVVVAAFGQILPRVILDTPPLGCLNVHPSLLPRYRGAAPINWTLIRGETVTGVTIMLMDEGVDTGDILLQKETPIAAGENYDSLHERLSLMGAELLVEAIPAWERGELSRRPQDHEGATYAPRLKREDGLIRWERGGREVVNLIRGLSSVPGAYTYLEGRILKVFAARFTTGDTGVPPGTVGKGDGREIPVSVSDGWVSLQEVQLEGKKKMAAADFLRGFPLSPGRRLGQ